MKPLLKYSEVYISNVCNYSCNHCQSLNNFAFKGHQRWDDYKDEYRKLSEKFDIARIVIIGGEPLLNPDFEKWLIGISELWPKSKLQISTNGTYLDKITEETYQILARHNGTVGITCHDINMYGKFLKFANTFLKGVVAEHYIVSNDVDKINWNKTYNSVKGDSPWPNCEGIENFENLPADIKSEFCRRLKTDPSITSKTISRTLVDINGVEVMVEWSQSFVPSVIEIVDGHRLKINFDSDPDEAHEICYFKECHQMNKGKLYKCPLVSVFSDFSNQFTVEISDKDRELMESYKPLTSQNTPEEVSEFIDDIENTIPQCKFCPSNYNTRHNFLGSDKKIKIVPIT